MRRVQVVAAGRRARALTLALGRRLAQACAAFAPSRLGLPPASATEERVGRLIASAAVIWMLAVAGWGINGRFGDGHFASTAAAAVAGDNMWRYGVPYPILTYVDGVGGAPIYMHHPLGSFWIAALVVKLFGAHDWVARLPAVVYSALTPLFVYLFGRAAWRPVPAGLSALAYVSLPITLGFSSFHALEGGVIVGMIASSWGYARFVQTKQARYAAASAARPRVGVQLRLARLPLGCVVSPLGVRPHVRAALSGHWRRTSPPRRLLSRARARPRCPVSGSLPQDLARDRQDQRSAVDLRRPLGGQSDAPGGGAQGASRLDTDDVPGPRDRARQARASRHRGSRRHAAERARAISDLHSDCGDVPIRALQAGRGRAHLLAAVLRALLRPRDGSARGKPARRVVLGRASWSRARTSFRSTGARIGSPARWSPCPCWRS